MPELKEIISQIMGLPHKVDYGNDVKVRVAMKLEVLDIASLRNPDDPGDTVIRLKRDMVDYFYGDIRNRLSDIQHLIGRDQWEAKDELRKLIKELMP